jgi:xanthine dehydrogenase molybdenum-binding subunit
MENQITLTVNGQPHTLTVTPTETLADALRVRLKLTGTKIGCEEAECGVCTVLVNGEPTLSCVYPAGRADGKDILTIEGLANTQDGKLILHPLQDAFVQHGAVQCGFCIPGQIMTSYALLKRNPEPSSDELRHALKDTLCRCAGYPTIERAILDAAHALRTGEPIQPPHIPDSINAKKVIGKGHVRPDAVEKVTGEAIYSDDLDFPGMLFASVRRAGVPHAILKSLDTSKAKALPGVVAVLTATDIPGEHNHGLVVYDWPVMVGLEERVRYVGDALAIVAAETQEIAEQAVALVEAQFEAQTVVKNAVQAYQPDAPKLHESGNLLSISRSARDMDEGLRRRMYPATHFPHCHHRPRLPGAGVQHRRAARRRAHGNLRRLTDSLPGSLAGSADAGLAGRARACCRPVNGRWLRRQGRRDGADPFGYAGECHRAPGETAL